MQNKIKSAFENIHADDNLKNQTISFIKSKTHNKYNILRPICAAFVCLTLIGFGGYKAYFTPTSIISIDINPSIELDVNRFDKIISVESYNPEGDLLSNSLNILFKDYNLAIDEILQNQTVLNYLSNDESLSIAVLQIDQNQGQNILEYVSDCTSQNENMHCSSLNYNEVADAHSLGLSYGKYKAYLKLKELGIELTPDQINQMTMREINDLIYNANTNVDSNQISNNGNHHQYSNQNGHNNKKQH